MSGQIKLITWQPRSEDDIKRRIIEVERERALVMEPYNAMLTDLYSMLPIRIDPAELAIKCRLALGDDVVDDICRRSFLSKLYETKE